MNDSIERARHQFLPVGEIHTLFVAEAPPADPHRFFYFEQVPRHDWLFLGLMRGIYGEARDLDARTLRREKPEYLSRFQDGGYYLVDACEDPMPSFATRAIKRRRLSDSLPGLISRIEALVGDNTRVVLISKNVYSVCCGPLRDAGINVVNTEAIDFPSSGRQRHFHRKLRRALDVQLRATIRGLEASVEFFGAGEDQQIERDLWVVEHFLRGLGLAFEMTEIKRPPTDPPDAEFRGAAFEVKEILEHGRKRGDEYKQQLKNAEMADNYEDLMEQITPESISVEEVYQRIMEVTMMLAQKKYSSEALRHDLDLLFYVNLGLKTAWGIDDGHRPSIESLIDEGWRSVSFLHGLSTSCVVWASESTPPFLKAKQGQLIHSADPEY